MDVKALFNKPAKSCVLVYLKAKKKPKIPNCIVIGKNDYLLLGDKDTINNYLEHNQTIIYFKQYIFNSSTIPLLDYQNLPCRIEPNATIREGVTLAHNCIILSGAVINLGAKIGEHTMIDMNAVIGSKARIGNNCHIGAGAVIAGVLEPAAKEEVIIEDGCLIGANAVILEGVKVGANAIVGAGSIVTKDVLANTLVYGNPAKEIKKIDSDLIEKTKLNNDLRKG